MSYKFNYIVEIRDDSGKEVEEKKQYESDQFNKAEEEYTRLKKAYELADAKVITISLSIRIEEEEWDKRNECNELVIDEYLMEEVIINNL